MIEAVIFDMDGLLIDSEPCWKQAEKEGYASIGIEMSPEMLTETTGLKEIEAVSYWYKKRPWDNVTVEELTRKITDRTTKLIIEEADVMPGAVEAILLAKRQGLKTAVASSSDLAMIHVVLDKLGVRGQMDVIKSAEHEEFGKPHPAVYLTTANGLGVKPENCVALEDSPNGVLSAKAANMKCIAVPEPKYRHRTEIATADIVIESLTELSPAMLA